MRQAYVTDEGIRLLRLLIVACFAGMPHLLPGAGLAIAIDLYRSGGVERN